MPQLNPEFFISQLFWLIVTFSFLLIFLWRISLPRISSVLEKRESKINNDIELAKELQTEAEEIQNQIEQQLGKTRQHIVKLIKESELNFQNKATTELSKLDSELSNKIDESANIIENNKKKSLNQIHEQIYEITRLTLLKLSSIAVDKKEIKESIAKIKLNNMN
mgnify:CR=1 FL=1